MIQQREFDGLTAFGQETNQQPADQELFNNYGGEAPVSFETWQQQLAFERTPGAERETIARTRDAQEAYENYVSVWNASDQATRNAIDIQHGFAVAPPPEPVGGGGGGSGADTTPKPFTDRIEDAADAPREEISPPATGLESTPIVEATVESEGLDTSVEEIQSDPGLIDRSAADDEVEEARVVNNFAPIEPSNIVVDPGTGQEFASPAAARAAGITNWVYKDDHQG